LCVLISRGCLLAALTQKTAVATAGTAQPCSHQLNHHAPSG
jgi:hypothetical protein